LIPEWYSLQAWLFAGVVIVLNEDHIRVNRLKQRGPNAKIFCLQPQAKRIEWSSSIGRTASSQEISTLDAAYMY
jgi:hypothetical protein